MPFKRLIPTILFVMLPAQVLGEEMRVAIRADFPGGNVKVVKNEGSVSKSRRTCGVGRLGFTGTSRQRHRRPAR